MYEVVEVRNCPECGKEIHNIDYGCLPYSCADCRQKLMDDFDLQSKARAEKENSSIARMEAMDEWEESP